MHLCLSVGGAAGGGVGDVARGCGGDAACADQAPVGGVGDDPCYGNGSDAAFAAADVHDAVAVGGVEHGGGAGRSGSSARLRGH